MTCAVCGDKFTAQRTSARYCTGKCKKRAQRRRCSDMSTPKGVADHQTDKVREVA